MKRITLTLAVAVVSLDLFAGSALAQRSGDGAAMTAGQHKQMMDDAGDEQEGLRESLAAKDVNASNASATKLQAFMLQTQTYWAPKKFADVNKLADTSVAQSKDVVAASVSGKLDDARSALDKLSATCNACHELHPEKR